MPYNAPPDQVLRSQRIDFSFRESSEEKNGKAISRIDLFQAIQANDKVPNLTPSMLPIVPVVQSAFPLIEETIFTQCGIDSFLGSLAVAILPEGLDFRFSSLSRSMLETIYAKSSKRYAYSDADVAFESMQRFISETRDKCTKSSYLQSWDSIFRMIRFSSSGMEIIGMGALEFEIDTSCGFLNIKVMNHYRGMISVHRIRYGEFFAQVSAVPMLGNTVAKQLSDVLAEYSSQYDFREKPQTQIRQEPPQVHVDIQPEFFRQYQEQMNNQTAISQQIMNMMAKLHDQEKNKEREEADKKEREELLKKLAVLEAEQIRMREDSERLQREQREREEAQAQVEVLEVEVIDGEVENNASLARTDPNGELEVHGTRKRDKLKRFGKMAFDTARGIATEVVIQTASRGIFGKFFGG